MAIFLGALLDPKWGYRIEAEQYGDHFEALAYTKRDLVGTLEATRGRDKHGAFLVSKNIWVRDDHRRRGLATELYRQLEAKAGAKFRPSDFQTTAGRAFWAQSNRPFGGLRPLKGTLPTTGPVPVEEVLEAMWRLKVTDIPFDLLKEGMEVEREHGDLTKRDAVQTAKIALAHLRERRDYYKLLKKYVERG